jgi:hypothetical protein
VGVHAGRRHGAAGAAQVLHDRWAQREQPDRAARAVVVGQPALTFVPEIIDAVAYRCPIVATSRTGPPVYDTGKRLAAHAIDLATAACTEQGAPAQPGALPPAPTAVRLARLDTATGAAARSASARPRRPPDPAPTATGPRPAR